MRTQNFIGMRTLSKNGTYEAPKVEIIEVEVEKGFAQSSAGATTTEDYGNTGW